MISKKDKRLGRNIRRNRKRLGWTQEQLAEKAKISVKHIQLLESAKSKPSLKTLYRLARKMKIKPRDLVDF